MGKVVSKVEIYLKSGQVVFSMKVSEDKVRDEVFRRQLLRTFSRGESGDHFFEIGGVCVNTQQIAAVKLLPEEAGLEVPDNIGEVRDVIDFVQGMRDEDELLDFIDFFDEDREDSGLLTDE